MTRRSWIRRVFSPTPRSSRKPRPRVRLAIEPLEARLVLASFTVGTLADDGSAGTLRHAITQSNATPEADTITIPSSIYVPGFNFQTNEPQSTIQLNGTQLPTITSQLK